MITFALLICRASLQMRLLSQRIFGKSGLYLLYMHMFIENEG